MASEQIGVTSPPNTSPCKKQAASVNESSNAHKRGKSASPVVTTPTSMKKSRVEIPSSSPVYTQYELNNTSGFTAVNIKRQMSPLGTSQLSNQTPKAKYSLNNVNKSTVPSPDFEFPDTDSDDDEIPESPCRKRGCASKNISSMIIKSSVSDSRNTSISMSKEVTRHTSRISEGAVIESSQWHEALATNLHPKPAVESRPSCLSPPHSVPSSQDRQTSISSSLSPSCPIYSSIQLDASGDDAENDILICSSPVEPTGSTTYYSADNTPVKNRRGDFAVQEEMRGNTDDTQTETPEQRSLRLRAILTESILESLPLPPNIDDN